MVVYDIDEEKIKRLSSENSNFKSTSNHLKIILADFAIMPVSTVFSRSKESDISFIKPVAKIINQNQKRTQFKLTNRLISLTL